MDLPPRGLNKSRSLLGIETQESYSDSIKNNRLNKSRSLLGIETPRNQHRHPFLLARLNKSRSLLGIETPN